MKKIHLFLSNNSFEILLLSLLFHLYGSVFFSNLVFYGNYVRVANTFLLYFAATNSFFHRKNKISKTNSIIIFLTLIINVAFLYLQYGIYLNVIRNLTYLIFLILTLINTAKFLLLPNRLDKSLISASVVGYLLVIEFFVRVFLLLNDTSEKSMLTNVDFTFHTKTFIDIVYFCTVTITSIGYGDVLPVSHNAKMLVSLLGLFGQFYIVVVMSIMISKFISNQK